MFKFGKSSKVASACGYGSSGSMGSGGSGGPRGGGFGGGGFHAGGPSMNGDTRYNPVFDDLSEGTIVEQFMPVDPRRLHRIWRRIYLQDPVAGPGIELMRDIPWSTWEIAGITDPTIRKFYEDAFNAIGAVALMPEVTGEFLVMGKYIAHLIFDDSKGYFTNCIIQDPDFVKITPTPVPGWQPKMDLVPTPEMRAWASSSDERDIAAHDAMGAYLDELRSGREIPLMPENTIYVARATSPYDGVGASIFTRILMFCAYEKALVNSTITAAKRRASRIRHIKAGIDGLWEPEPHTLQEIADSFMRADEDPVGAIVVTRTGVEATEVGGNTPSDMIKISDEWDFLQKGKMNALGISDNFLTGDATYNSMDQVLSVFLDRMRALRAFHVANFLDEIAKRLARKHDYVKRTQAELTHRIRRGSSHDATDEQLIIPEYAFSKTLRPVGDETYMSVLSTLEEKGIPVTARDWMAAGGYNPDSVDPGALKEDLILRKRFSLHKQRVEQFAPEAGGEPGGGGIDLGGGGGLGGGDDMGGLGDLGGGEEEGGDMGDLGDLGDLGGDEAGGGEEAGGGGAEPPPEAGGGEAPVKASSFQEPSIQRIRELQLWGRTGTFLGLHRDVVLETAKRLMANPNVSTMEMREKMRTGNVRRDQILTYVLTRVGVIKGLKIGRDHADDIARALCDAQVPNLMDELAYVQACTYVSNRTAEQTSNNKSRVVPIRGLSMPGGNGKLIASGFSTNRKVTGA